VKTAEFGLGKIWWAFDEYLASGIFCFFNIFGRIF